MLSGLWVNHTIQVMKFRFFSIRSAGNGEVKAKQAAAALTNCETLFHVLLP